MSYLCLSGGQYSVLSRSRIVHAVVHVTVQLSASAFGAMALACGQLAGKTMAILSMLPAARKLLAPRGDAVLEETVVTVREVAVAYKRFPLYSSWAGLFNSLGENLPFLLLAVLFSPAAAGLFALTHRVLSLPITVVSSLIGEIFYSNAGSKLKNGTLSASFADTYRVLSFLITMPSLVIIIIGPDFFAFVFGEPWRESGVFAQFMALMIYSNFVSAPLCSIMSVYGRDREFLAFNVILIVCRLAGIAYGYQQQDLHLAIGVYCSISALYYLGLLLRLIYMSGNDLSTFVQNTLVPLALNTLLVIPLFFVTQRSYFDTSWWLVFCATGVFGFLYLFITARAQLARALASTSAS
jgi:O-antigen/teichoic acid export membrane protein